jgi:hypothetical protein
MLHASHLRPSHHLVHHRYKTTNKELKFAKAARTEYQCGPDLAQCRYSRHSELHRRQCPCRRRDLARCWCPCCRDFAQERCPCCHADPWVFSESVLITTIEEAG